MNDNQARLSAPRNARALVKVLCCCGLVATVVVGVCVWANLHFRHHLMWRDHVSRLDPENFQRIPDFPMPESPVPSDWVTYRRGVIEIRLPPELAESVHQPEGQPGVYLFRHGSRGILLREPSNMSEINEYTAVLQASAELAPDPDQLTVLELYRACYQADSDDFRWSMTQDEVKWHLNCIVLGGFLRWIPEGHTESFSRPNLEGFVHLGGNRGALIWQSRDNRWAGQIDFFELDESDDSGWIRTVCQSLKLIDETAIDPD